MQLPNRQIADGATPPVKEDMFEIQVKCHVRDCEINAKCVIALVFQTKLMDRNGTQEGRIDLVDVDSEALLSRSPPNPPTNTVRNSRWRKPDRQHRRDQKKQTSEKKSTLEEHRLGES
jgi:hypothetical protein